MRSPERMNIFQVVVICTAVTLVAATDFQAAGKAIDDKISALENAGERAAQWVQQKANATAQFVANAPERIENAAKNAGQSAVRAVGKVGERTGNWIARQGQKVENAAGGGPASNSSTTTPKPNSSTTTPKPKSGR